MRIQHGKPATAWLRVGLAATTLADQLGWIAHERQTDAHWGLPFAYRVRNTETDALIQT